MHRKFSRLESNVQQSNSASSDMDISPISEEIDEFKLKKNVNLTESDMGISKLEICVDNRDGVKETRFNGNIFNKISPIKGWKRGNTKYKPLKSTQISPVKPILCHLHSTLMEDKLVEGFSWVLSMSEQFYYDNTIQLVGSCDNNENKIRSKLLQNIHPYTLNHMLETLENISVVGVGGFGQVIRAQNKFTKETIAIKYLHKKTDGRVEKNFKTVLMYLQERYYLMQARNSPFVMQFKNAFYLPKLNGLFMTFEYCAFDLGKYCGILKANHRFDFIEYLFNNNKVKGTLDELHYRFYKQFNMNLFQMNGIMVFELFCMLEFLGECNLVHRDIKPENILVTQNGHLKLGDFGLMNNTKFVLRREQCNIYFHDLIPAENDKILEICGTVTYYDMETSLLNLKLRDRNLYNKLISDIRFSTDVDLKNLINLKMDCLNDLWAVGLIISQLLFFGEPFWVPRREDFETYKYALGFEKNKAYDYNTCRLYYIAENYDKIIKRGIIPLATTNETYYDFIYILYHIFKPREKRLLQFTEQKEIISYNGIIRTRVVNMKELSKINYFKKMNVTKHNVFSYTFPQAYLSLIWRSTNTPGMNVQEWIESLQSKRDPNEEKYFNFEPGCSINWD